MKKLILPHGEHIRPVVIYYDDVEKIIDILKEASDKVEILSDEYQFNDKDELLKSKKEVLYSLKIDIKEPYVSLNLKPDGIWLYINEDKPISRGVFEKIKQLLKKRRRKLGWLLENKLFSGAIMGISTWFLLPVLLKGNINNILLGITILLIGAIWTWWGFQISFKKHSTIYLNKRNELSFWKRKKDDIILAVISATIGILITLAVAKLLPNFLK